MVFTHAWGLRSDQWTYQIPALAEAGLRCVVYDRRGHGRSDRTATGYDIDTLAAVIDHFGLHEATVPSHWTVVSTGQRAVPNGPGPPEMAEVPVGRRGLPPRLQLPLSPRAQSEPVGCCCTSRARLLLPLPRGRYWVRTSDPSGVSRAL